MTPCRRDIDSVPLDIQAQCAKSLHDIHHKQNALRAAESPKAG
jgi:hypothetical protein